MSYELEAQVAHLLSRLERHNPDALQRGARKARNLPACLSRGLVRDGSADVDSSPRGGTVARVEVPAE